jgi:DNA helicase IV
VQRARSFAASNNAVLLTCYNTELATWIREEMGEDLEENGGRITVLNFHRLAAQLCRQANMPFVVDPARTDEWWEKDSAELLIEAAGRLGQAPLYDAIVVDEAQDFSPYWWDALQSLLPASGPMWAFQDKAQSLFRSPCDPPLPNAAHYQLRENCRNTKEIVNYVNDAVGLSIQSLPSAPAGAPPKVRVVGSGADFMGTISSEIEEYINRQGLEQRHVAIIVPSNKAKVLLTRAEKIAGVQVVDDASSWRRGEGVLCTTVHAFKGLEARAAIVCGLSNFQNYLHTDQLYVSLSRANLFLTVII